MILIGMFDSPFVRRVAVTMNLLGLPFEHRNWSVGSDFERIREFNPLGRVPTLITDEGEALLESSAILDYLDETVGPGRALLPASGRERRDALRLMAVASGAAEKGVAQLYEHAFRPAEKRHEPWLERCRTQMHAALAELEHWAEAPEGRPGSAGDWLVGGRLTQADVSVACVFRFLGDALGIVAEPGRYTALRAHSARCEALPAFQTSAAPFYSPAAKD